MDRSLTSGVTTRRRFLLSAGLLGAASVLAACTQQAPAAPTAAPAAAAKPTTAPARPRPAPTAARQTHRCASRGADHRAGAAAAKPTTAPAAAATTAIKDVPRSRQLLLSQGGTQGKYLDYDLWNAYALGANHQTGPNIIHEPLAFYSAYGDKEYMWLAVELRVHPGLQTAHDQAARWCQVE